MTDTIPKRLLEAGRTRGEDPAYHVRTKDGWRSSSWSEYAGSMMRCARALVTLGFQSGDRSTILGFNRPEWAIFDLGTMAAGGAPAGIYTTCSPPEVGYIVGHTAAPIALVENHDQWEKIRIQRDAGELPELRHVVLMAGVPDVDDDMVLTWDAFLAKAEETPESVIHERLDALEPSQLATLIYTSGTTGPPKGVMLSHDNLAWTADHATTLVGAGPKDCVVSYLPLSHIAEQMFTLHVPISTGCNVYFSRGIENVRDDFVEVQPTILFAVPRIWEKFYAGVRAGLETAPALRQKIAGWAMNVGKATNHKRFTGKGEPTGLLALQYAIARRLVFDKLKPKLGLGRARICVSGAAPISKEILEFFSGLDVAVREVYGQSEDTGPTSFNSPGKTRLGSVGPAFPGVEVKIAEDGEILVRGRNVFLGYYRDEAATAETLIDGWLHSGDLGKIDDEGFLHITGRKKDIIITAGGKNIAPKNIEAAIKDLAVVGEAVVIGDRRKFLSALISLDPDHSATWASDRGVGGDIAQLCTNEELRAVIQAHIDHVNEELARVEQIKRFTVLPRALEIGKELTPTLKVQRSKVDANFADEIEAMYAG